MGITLKTLHRLLDLSAKGHFPPRGAVLELGSQNLYSVSAEFLIDFIDRMRKAARLDERAPDAAMVASLAAGGKMSRLMELCGSDYRALDLFSDDKVLLFDLNLDNLPAELIGKFDLVTNFGTTEHTFDQVRAFRTVHNAAKPGGVIYHDVPMGGYLHHGYFCYTPRFFRDVAAANAYEILFEHYSISGKRQVRW